MELFYQLLVRHPRIFCNYFSVFDANLTINIAYLDLNDVTITEKQIGSPIESLVVEFIKMLIEYLKEKDSALNVWKLYLISFIFGYIDL